MACRESAVVGIAVVTLAAVVAAVLWIAFLKVLSGEREVLPAQTWTHTLLSGARFEFTYQLVNHTGWGGDSDGITDVVYYPSAQAGPEHVGQLSYPLTPAIFDSSTVIIHEAKDIVVFATSGRAYIRREALWSTSVFASRSFPGQGSPLLDGKIEPSSGHEGHFKFIGVEPQGPTLKVMYSDAVGSWLLVYTIVDETEPLRLVEATPFGQQH
ncbi:MAG: hypothetical protein H7A43_08765 [Verrucomicrobia bacterium]|nr:hypothetical protein [Verrucomicrobiota bacterium]